MSVDRFYTGVGSRSTPGDILTLMEETAEALSEDGWTLRSGGADGADTAFENGAKDPNVFFPWPDFNDSSSPIRDRPAKDIHPAWNRSMRSSRFMFATL